ncbi:YdeI/OmpD-associated family protein [Leptospira interrogans]|uniref:Bacteriocin-protection protein, YdeI/OmpD-associated family n=2 Tax=Leptospira interrogans TaxID=173 RepID=A0A0F6II94_LEPIR|nr:MULTISPECIES: YdeI/OmpD-associated family protein [Leptospira]EJO77221.1 bacteriocin-protection protein, YdeI/OmpD-associated family [Leptospira interrogans serovar Pomona str. Kennewicki LC82-25]EKR36316.1 bacteriocin-protection protein, YdeI/OmpD-associated family [Leptospira interrogans serovar Hebdomadis str. R499]EMI68396.1 bacteriocin-protection protein, YdeI/OmpD-associated family [Leptospira interrogans serovar Pomona str. CSL10083]EMJ37769.1 bacteriocin-protection protein, YdeI/OmpD
MIDWNPNLIKKMRLKKGNKLIVFDQEKVHTSSPIGGVIFTDKISEAEGILFFADSASSLQSYLSKILKSIREESILWIAYTKKSSGTKTDLDRDHGWELLSKNGYEGVALISLDETWSALRFKKTDAVKKGGSKAEKQKRPELSKYINYKTKTVKLPGDVKKFLSKDKNAIKSFESLSWSHKREYIEAILDAKLPETRLKRIQKLVHAMSSIKVQKKK